MEKNKKNEQQQLFTKLTGWCWVVEEMENARRKGDNWNDKERNKE